MCFRRGHRRARGQSAFFNLKGHLPALRSFRLSPWPIPGVLSLCSALHAGALGSVASSPWWVLHRPSHSAAFYTTPLTEFLSCPVQGCRAATGCASPASPCWDAQFPPWLPADACFPFKSHLFKPFLSPPHELTSRLCAAVLCIALQFWEF